MVDTKTKTVNMTYQALSSYIMNTYYRTFSGLFGLVLAAIMLLLMIFGWNDLEAKQKVIMIIIVALFFVINPLMLMFKAYQQLKLSPSYKKPLNYTFTDEGIVVSQEDVTQEIPWDNICRLFMTGKIVAIYTSRLHAFVLPLSELGDEKGKILAALVQFSAGGNARISRNLMRYKSGKGM